MIRLSSHAERQAARRNFSETGIQFIMKHGNRERKSGVIFYQLLRKSIPDDLPPNDPLYKLLGSTVVACSCGQYVITLYKNPDAFKNDKKKHKYNRNKERCYCPVCHGEDTLH